MMDVDEIGRLPAGEVMYLRTSPGWSRPPAGLCLSTCRSASASLWRRTGTASLRGGRLPLVAGRDREAMQMAIASLRRVEPRRVRLVRIRNTKELDQVWVSEAGLPELLASGRVELLADPTPPAFDAAGNLW